MSKVDFSFGPRGEPSEPLFLNFVASRPPAAPRPEPASDAPPAEDAPLHLDLASREPQPRRPGATYDGWAGDPAAAHRVRTERSIRSPLIGTWAPRLGLIAIVGAAVAGALWGYAALERRTLDGGDISAQPAPPATTSAPAATVATVKPLAPAHAAESPAAVDTAALEAPPPPPQEMLTKPAPRIARPKRQETPRASRPRSSGPEASAATARANITEAYAPLSTLAAQSAAQSTTQARPAGN